MWNPVNIETTKRTKKFCKRSQPLQSTKADIIAIHEKDEMFEIVEHCS